MKQFENFTASSLYCQNCRKAMPVRERLLLVLPGKEIYDYLCTGCGASLGTREMTVGGRVATQMQSRRTAPAVPRGLIY